jgi:hypothetical protein
MMRCHSRKGPWVKRFDYRCPGGAGQAAKAPAFGMAGCIGVFRTENREVFLKEGRRHTASVKLG